MSIISANLFTHAHAIPPHRFSDNANNNLFLLVENLNCQLSNWYSPAEVTVHYQGCEGNMLT